MKAMTEELFFADTYAIIEIIKGNPNYSRYLAKSLVTSSFNLTELYYYLLRNFGEEKAEHYLQAYAKVLVSLNLAVIRQGMRFRLKYKNENLSYADCIGYAVAAELGMKFLTGDEKFRNKVNVEFVK